MKKKLMLGLATCLIALVFVGNANADITMTFEEFLGSDSAPLATFYSGITFESMGSGSDWVARDILNASYNASSDDMGYGSGSYHINGYVGATTALDASGNGGKITFDNGDATYFGLNYSALNPFYVEAYDASGNLINSVSGAANTGGPAGYLQVNWDGTSLIDYVLVHDSGDYWIVDDLVTDATGITGTDNTVPVPGALLLGSMGCGLVGWLKRRRSL